MGITQMSEIGRGAAAVMMADRDLLALAPTGSGKTLGYLLPLLTLLKTPAKAAAAAATADGAESSSDEEDRDGSEDDQPSSSRAATAKVSPRAIILSPTHELAQQIASETLKLTQGRKWRIAVLTKANELSIVERGADVLICTPQRLVAAIERRGLSLAQTKHLIIDESDRLLDKTFLPVVDTILTALTDKALRRALFTATLPSDLEEIAKGMGTGESIRVIVGMKCVLFGLDGV
jgi:ATP-dependent RNA helicase DDX52/ROK1